MRATPIKGGLFSPRPEGQYQQQPTRRPLSIASGNASSQSSQENADGQENQSSTPEDIRCDSNPFTLFRPKPVNSPFRIPSGRPKSIAVTDREYLREQTPIKSSPLKRSDCIMNLDQPSFGSPSAKRRSLHGPSFEIAKDEEMKTDVAQQSDEESDPDFASFRASLAPRLGAARKFHGPVRMSDRNNSSRKRRSLELDFSTPAPRRAVAKQTSRVSLDEDFTFRNDAANAGSAVITEQRTQFAKPTRPHPHPLSRTIEPASPLDPPPTHLQQPLHHEPDTPDERPAFSKSLPIGALRPRLRQSLEQSSQESSDHSVTFATPRPFDDARPDPAAFRSTGLISKRHRNPDDMPPPPGGHNAMPDTPCKKTSAGLGDETSPTSITSIAKPRFAQPLFGTPIKPFSTGLSTSRPTGVPLFAAENDIQPLNRSASFISNEGSDSGRSPNGSHGQGESQSSADELPPTPTKQIFGFNSIKSNIKGSSLRSSLFGRRTSVGPNIFSQPESTDQDVHEEEATRRLCKSSRPGLDSEAPSTQNLAIRPLARKPTQPLSSESPIFSSLSRSRQAGHRTSLKQPSKLSQRPLRQSSYAPENLNYAKTRRVTPVTQSLSHPSRRPAASPQTPAEFGVPDPSQLSISPSVRGAQTPSWRNNVLSAFSKPPETPSSHQNHAVDADPGAILATPSHGTAAGHNVDPVLAERFKKVDWLGSGQFSEVFKVHQGQQRVASGSNFSPSAGRGLSTKTTHTPLPDAVFVVKKTKAPLYGSRARERTVREVQIMQALGRQDHNVMLIDSWEARSHLYMMLEYCEEGTLDSFLMRTGRNGRLDDFRIWKTMLEVGAGLKHIHDSGFLHLDLKPENVFIDFSGALKIGDFGLACEWPAPKSIEGEGDRRYIGPDLLLGNFDKPADIFAFGMMMYEIAGNCVPPDNGTNWHKLRSGDFSGLPSLTSDSSTNFSKINSGTFGHNDGYGSPPFSPNTAYDSRPDLTPLDTSNDVRMASSESLTTPRPGKPQAESPSELTESPAFMLDPHHPASLDKIVHWMMLPLPQDRPVIDQVLDVSGCRWVAERRRAGAVVWEGPFGPSDAVLMPNAPNPEPKGEQGMSGIAQDSQTSQGTFFDDDDAEMMDA